MNADDKIQLVRMIVALLVILFALGPIHRARTAVSSSRSLTGTAFLLLIALRLSALGLIIAIIARVVPTNAEWLLWGLLVLVIAVGWSVRDLVADVIAGAILSAEQRIRKGVWVSAAGFQGTVERRTLRATWLRDGQGHRITVPNRSMVGAPMVYDSGADAEREVVVRLEGYSDATKVRQSLHDAVLSSPWVLAGATPVVLRDPGDPFLWRVRSRLLEPRFAVHFEGELLERVEDLLRYESTRNDPHITD